MADGRDSPDGQQRQKIQIRPIMEARKRQVTFMKRKKGLIKKAKELAILCGADLSVILFNPAGQMFEFSSGNMEETLSRFEAAVDDPNSDVQRDIKTNNDYKTIAKLDEEEEEALRLDAVASAISSSTHSPLIDARPLSRTGSGDLAGSAGGSSPWGASPRHSGMSQPSPGLKPGKLPAGLHASMSDQLTDWCMDNPGVSIPPRVVKEELSLQCGVPVRSIEYWFWARNKKIRAGISPSSLVSPRTLMSPGAREARGMAGVSRQHRALFATDPAARCPRDEDDEDDGCEEDYEEDADGEGEADGNGEDGETEDDEEEEHAAKRFRVISGTDSDDDDEADENEEFGSPAQLQDVLGGSRRASPLTLGTTHLGEAGDDRVLSKIADDWRTVNQNEDVGMETALPEFFHSGPQSALTRPPPDLASMDDEGTGSEDSFGSD